MLHVILDEVIANCASIRTLNEGATRHLTIKTCLPISRRYGTASGHYFPFKSVNEFMVQTGVSFRGFFIGYDEFYVTLYVLGAVVVL